MYGGAWKSRDASATHRRGGQGRLRLGVTVAAVAVLAAGLVSAERRPAHDVLATTAGRHGAPSAPPSIPVHLPHTHGAVRSPASVSVPLTPAAPTVAQAIPDVALAAYERSAAVMNAADPTCHLDWTLLAAIGQVESDHGQFGLSRLDAHGVAHPAIVGPRLDGRHGTARVLDTDAGRLDGDRRFDRAVGPMQFLPSTWAAVAVDGDDDGRRDPQDINDAALGSAIYLCSEHDDLATKAGAEAALLRYNHSASYVARVLDIARQLRLTGLLASVSTRIPVTPPAAVPAVDHPVHHTHHPTSPPGPVISDPVVPSDTPTTFPPSPPATPWPSASPTGAPTGSPTGWPTGWPTGSPTPTGTADPSPSPSDPPTSSPTGSPTTGPTGSPPTAGPTGSPSPTTTADPTPVIPDPTPTALAGFTRRQIRAYDEAWPVCRTQFPDTWADSRHTKRALRRCLADELGVPRSDGDLHTFVHWVARHEYDPR